MRRKLREAGPRMSTSSVTGSRFDDATIVRLAGMSFVVTSMWPGAGSIILHTEDVPPSVVYATEEQPSNAVELNAALPVAAGVAGPPDLPLFQACGTVTPARY